MKQLLAQASTALILSQLWIHKALALTPPDNINGINNGNFDANGIKTTIVNVITTVLDFVTLIGVIYVIIAGLRLIVSGGDEGEKDKAKQTIIYVVVGIIIILFARVIVGFVGSLFG